MEFANDGNGFYGHTPWATRTTPGRTLILLR